MLVFRKRGETKVSFLEEEQYGRDNREEDLHSLVADNPILILRESSDGSHLPALTLASHLRLGDVEADLLIVDLSGSAVLVELKKDRTPRNIVTQILDYAARLSQMSLDDLEDIIKEVGKYSDGLLTLFNKLLEENPEFKDSELDDYDSFRTKLESSIRGEKLQLVIVSYSVDEDVQRVVQYLRDVYEMNIYAVEFEYYAGGDQEYFLPEIIGVGSREPPKPQPTDTQTQYLDFWGALLDGFNRQIPNVTRQRPLAQSWLSIPIGFGGIHLEWAFHGKPRNSFEVGLHFERPTRKENQRILELLKQATTTLEKELGVKLIFQENWGRKWSRILTTRDEGVMTEELKKWAVDTMVKFYKSFKPRVDSALSILHKEAAEND